VGHRVTYHGRGSAGEAGWTLMELMIVIAIFGLAMGVATVSFKSITRANLRSAAFRTAGAARYVFDRATMTGMYMRLVFNIDKGEIWIEQSSDMISLRPGREQRVNDHYGETAAERKERLAGRTEQDIAGEAYEKKMRQREKDAAEASKGGGLGFLGLGGSGAETGDGSQDSEADSGMEPGIDQDLLIYEWERDQRPVEPPRASFSPLKNLVAHKIKLARGVRILDVTTPRLTVPVDHEYAFIYFFPQGHSEAAVIHFTDGKGDDDEDAKFFSVVLHPLTGQAKVYGCYYEIPEDFGVSDDKRKPGKADLCASKGAL